MFSRPIFELYKKKSVSAIYMHTSRMIKKTFLMCFLPAPYHAQLRSVVMDILVQKKTLPMQQ